MALCDPEQMKVLKKRHKYGAKRVTVDGHNFMSRREGARYRILKLLQDNEDICELALQPRYDLYTRSPDQKNVKIGAIVLDFQYFDHRSREYVLEDVKGFDNTLSKWKRKHFEAQYGIKVTIIK